jgi:cytochrome c-type biogenesis protein CcmH/NrfF
MGQPGGYVAARETPALAREIIDGSMSPYCPGLTLAACPSPSADSLRLAIIARVNQGESKAHLMADLEQSYGAAIRATPSTTGFGLVGWAVPGVAFLIAALVVYRWLRRATISTSS